MIIEGAADLALIKHLRLSLCSVTAVAARALRSAAKQIESRTWVEDTSVILFWRGLDMHADLRCFVA